MEFQEQDGPNVARLTAMSLKLLIRYVIRDPSLYQSFKVPKVEAPVKDLPSLDEVRAVAKALEWPPLRRITPCWPRRA